mmetsp:Transcript_58902/g.97372  ORF Transcript_58902/g.97372 Transcript_58902/m.97372 type:complete len:433 (-) Transcript_58902:171-1469(-)
MHSTCILRGELFKAGDGNSTYRLRWFELESSGELRWYEPTINERSSTPPRNEKGSINLRGARITLEADERRGDEDRFGFRLVPNCGTRLYALQASSAEERRLWVDEIETVAQPDIFRSSLLRSGRTLQLRKEPGSKLGIDLGSRPGYPCVTVLKAEGAAANEAGLLAGDVVLTMDNVVLRNAVVASRMFKQAQPGILTLRLATWNHEVKLKKLDGKAGMSCVSPASGDGCLVSYVVPGAAAESAGLKVGDRLLGVDGELVIGTHDTFSNRIRSAGQEIRLVVSGFTIAFILRKDAEGVLGLRCDDGAPLSVQGANISEVMPRCAARDAGLRSGDLIVAANGELVRDGQHAMQCIASSGRTVQLILWRPRPDAPTSAATQRSPIACTSTSQSKQYSSRNTEYYNLDALAAPHSSGSSSIYVDLTVMGGAAGNQ